jgi:hypothetical protein
MTMSEEESTEEPTVGEQNEEMNVGAPDEFEGEQGDLEDVFAVLEAFHGNALASMPQNPDRIRELEMEAELSALETALRVVGGVIGEAEAADFIGDREEAQQFVEVSRRARGVEIDDIELP